MIRRVCVWLWERYSRVFRGANGDPCAVWSLVRFCVSLWALVSKTF